MRSLVGLMLVICISTAFGQDQLSAAKKIDWTAQNKTKLSQLFQDSQTVTNLVHRLYGDAVIEPNVGEHALVDLHHDGTLQLVVTLDFSGRAFYTTVLIISKVNGQFQTHELSTEGANLTDLASHIVDLRQDGTKQLLIPRLLGPYAGASPMPTVADVYKWDGQKPVKADGEYKDFYRTIVLPDLKRSLADLDAQQNLSSTANKAGPENKQAGQFEEENKKLRDKYLKEIDEVKKIIDQ